MYQLQKWLVGFLFFPPSRSEVLLRTLSQIAQLLKSAFFSHQKEKYRLQQTRMNYCSRFARATNLTIVKKTIFTTVWKILIAVTIAAVIPVSRFLTGFSRKEKKEDMYQCMDIGTQYFVRNELVSNIAKLWVHLHIQWRMSALKKSSLNNKQ